MPVSRLKRLKAKGARTLQPKRMKTKRRGKLYCASILIKLSKRLGNIAERKL